MPRVILVRPTWEEMRECVELRRGQVVPIGRRVYSDRYENFMGARRWILSNDEVIIQNWYKDVKRRRLWKKVSNV